MWRGIRARTTATAAAIVLVVLVVTSIALVTSQRRILTDSLDESLVAQVNELATTGTERPVATLPIRGDDDAVAQIASVDGDVVAVTPNFAGRPAIRASSGTETRTDTVELLAGEPDYRVASRRTGHRVIHAAAPLDDIDDSVTALRTGLAVAIPLVVLALAGLVWWLTGRTLEPVDAIRREVADISSRNLHRRVPEPHTGDEIERLARTMNAMLDRVEMAVERQRRFVADASHELRSPLARIRTELEVDVEHPGTADPVTTHLSVLDETEHLERMVEDLLILARIDTHPNAPTGPVDLDDVVIAETARLRGITSVALDISGVTAAQVEGDRPRLVRVVRNLLDNATRFANHTVTVSLDQHGDRVRLVVTDDGPGVAEEHREVIFDRFTRVDSARSQDEGGTGLGLAIAREIIESHGGTIVVEPVPDSGGRFVIDLPATGATR